MKDAGFGRPAIGRVVGDATRFSRKRCVQTGLMRPIRHRFRSPACSF